MKKLVIALLMIPAFAYASFDGVTPSSPVNSDASGSMTCYPYVYAYNGSVGRTYIASTESVDFSGSGIYSPAITNGGTGLFLKDTEYTASNPPTQEDWDDHSVDYSTADNSIVASWWTDNGVSNITTCGDLPPPGNENADAVYLYLTWFIVTIAVSVVFTSMLTGVAFKNILK